ncbi:MAG TPA: Sec-independent protein translocase subunit TatA [Actinomycetes bacterium]|nr:Sec-independent protein translocase subunit TatA [Actinomycetes bacterium]
MLDGLRGPEGIILIVLIVLLFGAKRLPDAARGLGRSLRIFKAETRGLTDDEAAAPTTTVQQAPPPAPPQPQVLPQAQQAPAPTPPAPAPAPQAQPAQQAPEGGEH